MAESRDASPFSADLSRHLRDFMDEHEIAAHAVAARLDRSPSYVSEHTSGKRPPDSDLLDAVASLAGISTQRLVLDLLARMEPGRG